MKLRDSQRSRLYTWESSALGTQVFAESLSLEEVRAYVARIWRAERRRYGHAKLKAPVVKDGRGHRHAGGSLRQLTFPRWSRNPWVVLHELAHALTQPGAFGEYPRGGWHGPRFVGCLIGLACRHLGFDRAVLLKSTYQVGLKVDARSVGATPRISISRKIWRVLQDGKHPMLPIEVALELGIGYRTVLGGVLSLVHGGLVHWRGKRLAVSTIEDLEEMIRRAQRNGKSVPQARGKSRQRTSRA